MTDPPWSDPNHDVMADFREYLRPNGPSSVSLGGVDLAPYLSQYGFGFSHPRQWQAAPLRPATPLEIYLERSRERVRQQLGNVTHSWRDR